MVTRHAHFGRSRKPAGVPKQEDIAADTGCGSEPHQRQAEAESSHRHYHEISDDEGAAGAIRQSQNRGQKDNINARAEIFEPAGEHAELQAAVDSQSQHGARDCERGDKNVKAAFEQPLLGVQQKAMLDKLYAVENSDSDQPQQIGSAFAGILLPAADDEPLSFLRRLRGKTGGHGSSPD